MSSLGEPGPPGGTAVAPMGERVRRSWQVTYPLIAASLSTTALTVVDAAILGY